MSTWLADDRTYVWHPFTQMLTADQPLEIVKAKDTSLFTADGKSYLDMNSSWWVNVHGHGRKEIADAIHAQFLKIDHTIFAGATHHAGIEVAKRVLSLLPDHFKKVFFSDDGSTAIEVSLKMAIQYFFNKGEQRHRVLAIDGAYHGDTFGAMSVGQRGYFNRPFEHFFFDVDFLDFPIPEREEELLNRAEQLFATGEFACLIVEPLVQGSAGMRMYSESFLDQFVVLAKRAGVLVIFDEVMTGWGRTGKMFAMDHCEQKPDIVCLSKGLTGGTLPLGLTVATQDIFDAFLDEDTAKALLHGHSYTGNPLACAAAIASMELFAKAETNQRIAQLCDWNKRLLEKMKGKSCFLDVRMKGTILALEFVSADGSSYFSDLKPRLQKHFMEHGILLRPLGNVLFINPPYCISEQEYLQFETTLDKFLEQF